MHIANTEGTTAVTGRGFRRITTITATATTTTTTSSNVMITVNSTTYSADCSKQ